jgi:hypothetical protein
MRDDPGVPLAHYLQHPGAGVRFHCRACQASHDVPVARVVGRLKAHGLGDEQTGVRAVAWLADQPCARCGAVRWETTPAFQLMAERPASGSAGAESAAPALSPSRPRP